MVKKRMTWFIVGAAALTLALSSAAAVAAPGADAKKGKQPDLVVKSVTASISARTVQVSATVQNKANKKKGKKAKASAVGFVLSSDTTAGTGDTTLGQLAVGKLKPKKSQAVSGTFAVPATVPAGSYYVVACADAGAAVKEKKEQNNCSASTSRVNIAAPTPTGPPVTITYRPTSAIFGTVTGSATNGTCTADAGTGGGTCTVTPGVGTVTLTASFNVPVPAAAWQAGESGPCDGVKTAATVVFTAPTGNKSCVAAFA